LNNDVYSINPIAQASLDYHRWKRSKKLIINYELGLGALYSKSTETLTKNAQVSVSKLYFSSVGLNLDGIFIADAPVLRYFGFSIGGGYFVGVPSICSAIYFLNFGLIGFPINFH
jgi:hypothetical protein